MSRTACPINEVPWRSSAFAGPPAPQQQPIYMIAPPHLYGAMAQAYGADNAPPSSAKAKSVKTLDFAVFVLYVLFVFLIFYTFHINNKIAQLTYIINYAMRSRHIS